MSPIHGQTLLLFAAFWLALLLYRGDRPARFVLGLGMGAAFTHLGWAMFHWDIVYQHPTAVSDVSVGYSILFFPLGPLLAAPAPATWRALPLALAVARGGCLVAGCCQGVLGPSGPHPTAFAEIALLVLLHLAVRAAPAPKAAAVFLLGFGLERLVVEPWRAAPPLGEPVIATQAISTFWSGAGLLLLLLNPRTAPSTRENLFDSGEEVPGTTRVGILPWSRAWQNVPSGIKAGVRAQDTAPNSGGWAGRVR